VPFAELSTLVGFSIVLPEASAIHELWLRDSADKYDPSILVLLQAGEAISGAKYLKAQRLRTQIKNSFRAALTQCDVLATPTLPHPAVPIGQDAVMWGDTPEPVINSLVRYTVPFDVSGQPAIALPCGFTSSGLPISLQLAGRPFDEATICRAAHAYEAATDWHTRKPPIA